MNPASQPQPPPSGPGYYRDVPNETYHAGPGVSKSQLDLVNRAPALLEWSRKAPRDEEARAAIDIGDAFHAVLLEPQRFDAEYTVAFEAPPGAIVSTDDLKSALDERGIAYMSKDTKPALTRKLLDMDPDAPVAEKLREEWLAGVNGRTVLTAEEYRKLRLMRESALAHPYVRMLVEADGDVEPSIYWTDPETGLLCRCRPDKNIVSRRILLDVKTVGDMDRFAASIEDYRYHVQDAFYSEGHTRHYGEPPAAFLFLAVSTSRDAGRYPVRLFSLAPADREIGRAEFRKNLDTVAECERTKIWPGIETIQRPHWARRAA